jgi:UDP-glucose:glycoprotein glucosyltransferase
MQRGNSHHGLTLRRESAADEDSSVYYPILDRIADGYFDSASTDDQLYNAFLKLLKDDKLFSSPEALSSFQLGLSIHNSAPRIEAQYQFYKTSIEPLLEELGGKPCESWLQFSGKQYCSPAVETEDANISKLMYALVSALPCEKCF